MYLTGSVKINQMISKYGDCRVMIAWPTRQIREGSKNITSRDVLLFYFCTIHYQFINVKTCDLVQVYDSRCIYMIWFASEVILTIRIHFSSSRCGCYWRQNIRWWIGWFWLPTGTISFSLGQLVVFRIRTYS